MKRTTCMSASLTRLSGFTLIELMVTIAVLAILLSIAVPSFTSAINNNRIVSATNDLITAFALARNEATKRSSPVVVCPSNAGQTNCSGSTNWGTGLIVFVDDGATIGSLDSGETKIQIWSANTGGVSSTSTGTFTYIRYGADGTPSNSASITPITLTKSGCTGNHARVIAVSTTGRVSATSTACP